ncbi:hypothetical protein TthSNM11_24260 (plasmid) [Thermus thermophilus]|nr:hypothetical protein TthSNM11_24260 [Thermus thermophilus]
MWLPTPIGPLWLEVSPLGVRRLEPALYPRGPEAEGALALRVREAVQAYFAGERPDFLDLPLDYTGLSPARLRLYERVRLVPYGRTVSYGALGRELGLSPRAVGAALRACPFFLLGRIQRTSARFPRSKEVALYPGKPSPPPPGTGFRGRVPFRQRIDRGIGKALRLPLPARSPQKDQRERPGAPRALLNSRRRASYPFMLIPSS